MEQSGNGDSLVLDLDGTLFTNSLPARLLQRMSIMLHSLSFRFQRPNKKVQDIARRWTSVTIVSGRSRTLFLGPTRGQLKRHKVRYDTILLFPDDEIKRQWKKGIVEKMSPASWLDDEKPDIVGNRRQKG